MENKLAENKSENIEKYKVASLEGLKRGLLIFVISYLVVFLLALIINFTILDQIQIAVLGNINTDSQIGFGAVIKLTSILLSLSAFNSINGFEIGIVFLLIVLFPVIYLINGRGKKETNLINSFSFFISSTVFSIILTLLQLLTKGKLFDISINLLSFRNFIVSIFIVFLIQIIISLSYCKKQKGYILATRLLLRLSLGVSIILSIIDIVKFIIKLPLGLLNRIGAAVLLFPNMTFYKFFILMGNGIDISDTVDKLNIINNSYFFIISIILILVWITIVIISATGLNKEKYFKELPLFALLFSSISLFFGITSKISLGKVILLGDITIGINIFLSFLVAFLSIMALGLMLFIVRKILDIIKEI